MGPLLGNYFCDASGSRPSLCQATDPDPRSALVVLLCAPVPRGCGVVGAEGSLAWAGRVCQSQPGSSAGNSGMDTLTLWGGLPSAEPKPGLGGHRPPPEQSQGGGRTREQGPAWESKRGEETSGRKNVRRGTWGLQQLASAPPRPLPPPAPAVCPPRKLRDGLTEAQPTQREQPQQSQGQRTEKARTRH
uniref:Uncharacterized protein n=1 Tax=Pipistrellus kuhlii TaxID=59472 RepID=A0A7J7S414_PIPKU|nr:hypothetical protein mPipKuh1_010189 [Pipistrellus kuhlii]